MEAKHTSTFQSKQPSTSIWALPLLILVGFGLAHATGGQTLPFSMPENENDRIDAVDYTEWLEIGLIGANVNGDGAAFNAITGLNQGFHAGITSLHTQSETSGMLVTVDGRALYDINDYLFKVNITNEDNIYYDFGYREYRTWYDGSGTYFPTSPFFSLYDEELAIDRGSAWFEFGYTLPAGQLLTGRVEILDRKGRKSSTSQGDTNNPVWGRRNIVPAFYDIDESRIILSAALEQVGEALDYKVGLRYEDRDLQNARNMRRRPGESADRYLTHADNSDSEVMSANGYLGYEVNEKTRVTAGAIYTTLDMNLSGTRIFGDDYYSPFDPNFGLQRFDHGYRDLDVNGEIDQFVFNSNIVHLLSENTSLIGALRVESMDQEAFSEVAEFDFQNDYIFHNLGFESTNDWEEISVEAELRHTGLKNAVLTARAFTSFSEGDMHEREFDRDQGNDILLDRLTNTERNDGKITLDAKFYPSGSVTVIGQYYYRVKEYDFDHPVDDTPGGYPAFLTMQDFKTHDINLRVTWRAQPGFTSVTRFDYQETEIETRAETMDPVISGDLDRTIISQSITWPITPRMFFYGSVNYVEDSYYTPAAEATGAAADLVPALDNDYLTYNVSMGYAMNDFVDLDVEYFWYEADNWVNNHTRSVPYGASGDLQEARLRGTFRLSFNATGILQYTYFANHDKTSGGNNNYNAHGLYGKLQYRW